MTIPYEQVESKCILTTCLKKAQQLPWVHFPSSRFPNLKDLSYYIHLGYLYGFLCLKKKKKICADIYCFRFKQEISKHLFSSSLNCMHSNVSVYNFYIYILTYLPPFVSVSPHFMESHAGSISNSGSPQANKTRAAKPPTTLENAQRLQILRKSWSLPLTNQP